MRPAILASFVRRTALGIRQQIRQPTTEHSVGASALTFPCRATMIAMALPDLAVYRPGEGNWYILRSSGNVFTQVTQGIAGDKPVPADYDGDGKTDVAVFRPSNGLWTVRGSAGNYGSFTIQRLFGISTDIPVAADYDGDGKADIAVYRPSEGNWYVFRSSLAAGQVSVFNHGLSGDIPQQADYDNDRKDDYAVFRPSNNTWYINRSTAGIFQQVFGQAGDIPASSPNRIP